MEYAVRFLVNGGSWKYCPNGWAYYRMFLNMRPRLTTSTRPCHLWNLLEVLDAMESRLAEKGLLEECREAFAAQFWLLAKRAAFHADVQREAMTRFERLSRDGRLPEPWQERALYKLLGIRRRKRLVTFLRRYLAIQPFRPIAAVQSVADVYAFDHPTEGEMAG